jgi:hypothetical protein
MINFALIQLSPKHTEILGTFIEIIKYNHWNVVIYYDIDADDYTFLHYYQQLFGTLDIRNPSLLMNEYKSYNYYIYSSSGDDKRIDNIFKTPEFSNKTIFIMHQAHHLQPYMKKMLKVSPVINLPLTINTQYILPVYKSYYHHHNKKAKNKITFAVIGAIRFDKSVSKDKDIQLIIDILEKYPDQNYKIYFFMRNQDWKVITKKYRILLSNSHVRNYPGMTTINLINKLREIKYILPLAKKTGIFYWQRLTGAIPLAINLNIPLVMDSDLAKIYSIHECSFIYDTSITEIFDQLINVNKEEYTNKIISIMKYKKQVYKKNNRNLLQLCLSN